MDNRQHYDILCEVAEFYGLELQMGKTVEELGELTAALGRKLTDASAVGLYEEIADVYNMLDQLCILLRCEDAVQVMAEQKMERQLARIHAAATE